MNLTKCLGIAFVVCQFPLLLVLGQPPAPVVLAVEKAQPSGVTVRGSVVDDDGKPVAGANVGGLFWHSTGNSSYQGSLTEAKTNAQGEFTIDDPRLNESVTVSIRAWHDGAFTAKAVELKGEASKQPVRLAISKKNARGLTGRVVNERGNGVAGALIDIVHVPTCLAGYETRTGKSIAVNLPRVVTDAQGKFVVQSLLDPDGSYRVAIQATDHLSNTTPWKKMGDEAVLDLGAATIHQLQMLEGQVVDRQGQPVAGALVVHADSRRRVATQTDANGQFQLKTAFQPVGVFAVSKEGFRTTGRRCDGVEKMSISLRRRDEPAETKMAMLAPALPLEQRKALAAKLLEADWKAAESSDDDNERFRPLEWKAASDPAAVLEALDKKPLKSDWNDGYIRRAIAKRLAKDSFDDARAVVDSIRDPSFRTTGYIDLHDGLSADRKADKLACLDQALLHGKAIPQADHRIIYVGRVARRLMELDETARAAALLRDDLPTAKNLPTEAWGAYARGSFAENFGLLDLPAALELLEGLKDPMSYTRHAGNLACQLAASQPDRADEVFQRMQKNERSSANAESHLQHLCYRMARTDLPRARRIIETVTGAYARAQAHGAIAYALAKSNPKEALVALDQAFAALEAHANAGKDQFNNIYHGTAIAGLMIPVAEQIDPELTAEFFWRAASLGVPPLHEGARDDDNNLAESIGATAMVLAPYDRKLAKDLAEQAASFHRDRFARTNYIQAMALTDPAHVNDWIEKVPNPEAHGTSRQAAASMLLVSGDSMIRALHRRLFVAHPTDTDE